MGSWAWWRSWFLIFFGCSVMGAGFVLFVNPYNFVPGGVYGMGIVLHNIFPSIQVGTFGYMFDVPLMLVAMLVFGGQFGTRTVLAALYTPCLLYTSASVRGRRSEYTPVPPACSTKKVL